MKRLMKKISLLLILCSLITPGYSVWATGEGNTENNGGTNAETPSVSPSPSPSASPSPAPSAEPEVEPEKNDDATLKELKIDGVEFTETFNSEKLEYKAIVAGDVSSVKISATPNNVLSKIDASSKTGLQELVVGENTFTVKVVAESGKEIPYKITVVRAQSDLNLTKLNIQGQKLNEVFDPETYEYTADVTYNVTSITVQHGRPKGTNVSVSGNSNLKVGKNTVTVTVKNEIGDTKEYKIIVTRSDEENLDEDETEATTTEEVTTSDIASDITPVVSEDNSDIDLDTENDNTLRSVIIITSTVLLLLIAGLGIYFYVKTGNSEKKRQKKIEKLKRKQAKIEEQLTGLMPIITEEQEKDYLNNKEDDEILEDSGEYTDEELESTIEIDLSKEIIEPRKRRVDKRVLEDDFDDFDDLFDDRDE